MESDSGRHFVGLESRQPFVHVEVLVPYQTFTGGTRWLGVGRVIYLYHMESEGTPKGLEFWEAAL